MRRVTLFLMIFTVIALFVSACQPAPPEQVEVTRVVELPGETVVEEVTRVVEIEGETVTEEVEVTRVVEVPAAPMDQVVVEFWTTDNEEPRVDVYEEVAARYMEANPGVEVRIIPIEEAGVSQRIATAVASASPIPVMLYGSPSFTPLPPSARR